MDTAGYLRDAGDRERLERILSRLEDTSGFYVRVLTRDRKSEEWTRESTVSALACRFGLTSRQRSSSVIIVADRGIEGALQAGSSFLTFPVIGDNVQLYLPPVFWARLQREYGRRAFVESRGEAASIVTTCELIITCLNNDEDGCTSVPPASASYF